MVNKIINESMRIAGKKIDFDKKIDVEYPFTGEVIGLFLQVMQSTLKKL